MSYQDSNGLWHDKPNKKSNNVFVYGAFAKALNLDVSGYKKYYDECVEVVSRDNIVIHRHPKQPEPPLSFDEALGLVYLDGGTGEFLDYDSLKGNHFVYNGHGKRLDSKVFEKLAKAMLELVVAQNINLFMSKKKRYKQRNLWWRMNLTNVAYFSTRLNPAMTYVVKKFNNRSYHTEEEKLWAFFRDCQMRLKADSHGEYSQKNILWLMLIMNRDYDRARKLKPWVWFERYFTSEHPFVDAIRKKYNV